ncbi:MAG: hypothetical protein FWD50_02615 [Betaproteobacteria bacterium]|nr:hypothetical protein [Betaproteobacteria bacterium]
MNKRPLLIAAAVLSLAGCDQVNERLGFEDAAKKEARIEAEAGAVGAACRHSGRAIEDCYAIYAWLPKAGVYAGWREMDEYMRENKIETIVPQLPPAEPPGKKRRPPPPAAAESNDEAATPATDKDGDKK